MARTDGVWEIVSGAVKPIGVNGYDIMAYGTNRYFNFNLLYGSSGYGIRDNAGTIEYKNSGGSWTSFSAGGGSGDVVGPASATDGVPALFSGTTGKLLKNSTPTGTGNPVLQTSPSLITPNIGASTATSVSIGTLNYTPSNALTTSQQNVNSYSQNIIQNTSTGATASADYIVNNSSSTDSTLYGDFGMNSTGFTGTGAFSQPNNVYLTATTTDLAIGTTTANAIHIVANSNATDAITVTSANAITLSQLTASTALALDASKNIVSIANTGTGNNVLSASPTFTGTVSGITASMVGAPSGSGSSTGTNTGDQTSIVGITGTVAQFNTALTGDDFTTLTGTETLTNKTLTLPVLTNGAINFNAPQSFGVNYQIVTSVASGNLTVAIKTLNGTDPSTTDPISIRIGNTVRTLNTSCSMALNSGTNRFNSGSTELATQEIDFFTYLMRDTSTSSVRMVVGRYPASRIMGDFDLGGGNPSIKERGFNANYGSYNASDLVECIGRFNAILSAGTAYTWSLPATSVIINRPIYETRWLTIIPTLTWTGTAPSYATTSYKYKIIGNVLYIKYLGYNTGTGGANTQVVASLPFTPATIAFGYGNVANGTSSNAACVDIGYSNGTKATANFASVTAGIMAIGGFYEI